MTQHPSSRPSSRRSLLKLAGAAGLGAGALTLSGTTGATAAAAPAFAHPGLLHAQADLDRIAAKVKAGAQPYLAGWQRLTANGHAQSTWKANPQATVHRGGAAPQNFPTLYNDVHAAYQNALRWRISGDHAHGDAARDILNAWSGTLKQVTGSADHFLAAGIQGYQFANAAELLRGYPGFDLGRFKTMMLQVFYPVCDSFLREHNGAFITNYYASWDLLALCCVFATGVLCDDRAKVDQAVDYYRTGAGNGSLPHAIPYAYPNGLAQFQESGRDQGHTTLSVGLMGALCEMAWNQGIDLYGEDDNRFLKGAEYVAKYNLGQDVPFTRLTFQQGAPGVWSGTVDDTAPAASGRGDLRPIWAMIQNHYVNRRGLAAPYTTAMAAKLAPEGGGGDYGPDSGGFDQLGFGTLAFTRDKAATPVSAPVPAAAPQGPPASPAASTSPSPTGSSPENLAFTGSTGLLPLTGAGLLAIGGGVLALRTRARRKGAHRG
ncbi:alginate lyase family protein [Kitasatospora viridis]|uniref:Alginate lyase n=1 Tax=Kitasatospora viridis TaxID=281105 RepID=A0A561TVC2_9ACTN|nr:alginate lyase family protein [Kitasatospora viridis]TWF91057.1 alginate lyase [Kitasatospora viridis]